MASFNQVTLLGNLTRDPELKYVASGMAVANISLAINERIKKGDGWIDSVLFVDVSIFGKTAENCAEFCRKGSAVLISGRLKQERWEKDGVKHQKLTVTCDRLQFLDKRRDEYDQGEAPDHAQQAPRERSADVRPDDYGDAF